MKFICIGAGSIGKRHIRNLVSIGVSPSDITAVDPREDRLQEVTNIGVSATYLSLETALVSRSFDAGIICSPTNLHIAQGIKLAEKGIHILMEKPLADSLEDIDKFKDTIEKNNVVVLMAYIFRFSPLTLKVKELIKNQAVGKILFVRGEFSEYLPDWHPYEDYRSFYMAEKKQGGGSILDQSHIMDLIHYLFGGFKSVYALNGNLSSLQVNADDFSELTVTLKNGIIASIHTDMFGRDHKKELEIKGEKGNIYWNSGQNIVTHYCAEKKMTYLYNKFPSDFNLNYIDELKHFIDCCKKKKIPNASLEDGIDTMNLILSAYKSVETGAVVEIH